MPTATMVTISEYLETSYRPDCDYIDGELQERNLGESDHSRLQISLASYLFSREMLWGISAFTEQRVQVRDTRYRVPDITVVAGPVTGIPVLREPPFLCIEILSRGDSMDEVQSRIDDYLAFGVPYVWVLNPRTRRGFVYTPDGMTEAKDGTLRTAGPDIEVPFSELRQHCSIAKSRAKSRAKSCAKSCVRSRTLSRAAHSRLAETARSLLSQAYIAGLDLPEVIERLRKANLELTPKKGQIMTPVPEFANISQACKPGAHRTQ